MAGAVAAGAAAAPGVGTGSPVDIVTFLVIALVFVAVVGGTVAVVARGAGLWSPPALPGWASARRPRNGLPPARRGARGATPDRKGPADGAVADGVAAGVAALPSAAVPVTTASAPAAPAAPVVLAEPARPTERSVADGERLADRLAERLTERLGERLEGLRRETVAGREEAIARLAAVEARQEGALERQAAALERLRADVTGALAEATAAARDERVARGRQDGRRAEVTADLYARLARLEAALAAVTNPILLPGEPYTPPAEFLAEALVWENWKDVGERAFAFADAFNANRLHLPEPTAVEVAAFVVGLRRLLTGSVYPSLGSNPTPAQLASLRAALDELADTLPRLRERLASGYRAGEAA